MDDSRIKVLLIEDNPGDARLLREMLTEVGRTPFDLEWDDRLATGLERLSTDEIGLVLLDLGLPDSQGLETFAKVHALAPDVPIVVLSGFDDEATAVQAVRKGAQDYLVKGSVDGRLLVRAMRYALERKRAEEALSEERNLLRTLIDNLPDYIYIKDAEGRFVGSNIAVARQVGATRPDEIVGKTDFDLFPQELAAQYHADEQAIMRSGEPLVNREEPVVDHAGNKRWVLTTRVPLRDSKGQTVGVVGMNRDITELKQREREMEAIVQVSAALRTAETRAEMLPAILDQLLDLLNAEGAALAMCDPASGEAVCELGRGGWENWTGVRLPPGEGVSGHVLATGQPYLSNDVHRDRRFARPDLIGDLPAMACVPLITQEQIIGVLWVGHKADITKEQARLLTAIADITANAIRRATLHEQTQRRLRRLAALREIDMAISASVDLRVTLNILLDQVTTQLGVDAADVLLLKPHTQTLEYAAGRGFRTTAVQDTRVRLGEGHAGRAALERCSIRVDNLAEAGHSFKRFSSLTDEGFVTYCGVSLIAKGRVQGVLEIFRRSPFIPDPEWLDFLHTLAGQAAIAIDSAELFNGLQRSNIELSLAYETTLEGWARALELRDYETEGHAQRVVEMTLRLARAMGIGETELVHVRRGALLHDIGKLAIPDTILFKPGPLAEDEWCVMCRHPAHAYEMLTPIAYLRRSLDIPYYHHERWDGTGYPQGLQGEQIPLAARIFAVVDVWDALLSDRPYRSAWPEEKVLEYIREQAGKHFDPQVVRTFLELVMGDESTR